jgi:hypothetical protein
VSEQKPKNNVLDSFAPELSSAQSREKSMENLRARAERFYQEASLDEIVQLTQLVESLLEARGCFRGKNHGRFIDWNQTRITVGNQTAGVPLSAHLRVVRARGSCCLAGCRFLVDKECGMISGDGGQQSRLLHQFRARAFTRRSAFLSLSFGLGFRVLPALSAVARQFEP